MREFLRRMDARLEQGDRLLAKISEQVEASRRESERSRAEWTIESERSRAESRRQHELSREQTAAEFECSREEARAEREDMRAFMKEIIARVEAVARAEIAELRDLRAESRAQTQALLRAIDRMDRLEPGGSGAAG